MIYETPLAVSRENARNDLEIIMRRWTDGVKHVITHTNAPRTLHAMSECVGEESLLKEWVTDYPWKYGAIYVVSEGDVVYDMDELRPGLEFFKIVVRE
jgi:hypothetical protein